MQHELYSDLETIIDATGGIPVLPDGVYLDVIAGTAGTDFPVGLPGDPALLLADALTMLTARNLHKLYLVGARDFSGTYTPAVVNPTVMTDANVAPMKVNSLVGKTIHNDTDGSHGIITTNGAQTITANLAGGATNQWNPGDAWHVTVFYGVTFNQSLTLEVKGGDYGIMVADGLTVNFLGDLNCYALTLLGSASASIKNNFNSTGDTSAVQDGNLVISGDFNAPYGFFVSGTGQVIIDGASAVGQVENQSTGSIIFKGDCNCAGDVTNDSTGFITFYSGLTIGAGHNLTNSSTGAITVFGDLVGSGDVNNNAGVFLDYGNCSVAGDINNTTGNFTVDGDVTCTNFTQNDLTSTGDVLIGGNFVCTDAFTLNGDDGFIVKLNSEIGNISISAGILHLYGNAQVVNVSLSGSSSLDILGDAVFSQNVNIAVGSSCHITGIGRFYGTNTINGTLTYHGVYPEVPVNTTAPNAPATNDILNLALSPGFHWTVDKLILKCADPVLPNTITIALSQLVNGVLTVTTTAIPITHANYTQFFSLMDLFGVDHLSGDQLQITVQASGGGPIVVTGSYCYRSN